MAAGPSVPWKIELACRLRSAMATPYRWICEQVCMASPIAVRMHVYGVNNTARGEGDETCYGQAPSARAALRPSTVARQAASTKSRLGDTGRFERGRVQEI